MTTDGLCRMVASVSPPRVHLPVVSAPGRGSSPSAPVTSLIDPDARRIRYLRISLTDRCNLRCTYCRPDDAEHHARETVLTFEEIERIVRVFADLGVRKLRLTGGEPTLRSGIAELVSRLVAVRGIEKVVMTTNGLRLPQLAPPMAAAGLAGVNISIDTLDPDRFSRVSGGGSVAAVRVGVDAARKAGLPIKLNAVALRGVNDGEAGALCQYAWSVGASMRFIEHMPMSAGEMYSSSEQVTALELRDELKALGELVPAPAARDAGPARCYWIDGDPTREVGVISAMTEHFCDSCNRLRLTAAGDLHACLGYDDAVPLRDLLRSGAVDEQLAAAISGAVTGKRAGHQFQRSGGGGPTKHMISIGG